MPESFMRKLFLREQEKGGKRIIDRVLHLKGGGHLIYKFLSRYLPIRGCTCTLASIKMKLYEIKLKWMGRCTGQEPWIKIELISDVMLQEELIGVVESSLPSVSVQEFLGEQPMLQGALFLEHDLDPQQERSTHKRGCPALPSVMSASHEKKNAR